ncbi:MAG: flagellar basal-body MS-ring/collar protein FliF [bacterium]
MRERFEAIKNSALEFWRKLNKRQQLAVGLGGGAIIIGIFGLLLFAALRAGQPKYEPLFTNLESEDANAIVQDLKKTNTPYRLEAEGTAVLVGKKDVLEKRLELASKGLPAKGTVGYELFDQTRLGVTDFTQKVNLQRAKEGELSRTIMGLDAVEKARVMIVQPEPSLFVDTQEKSTASVALQLKSKKNLNEEQVRGIVHLIAASIEGLDPKNVTVVDSAGNILSDIDEKQQLAEKMKLTQLQLQHKKLIEDLYQDKIYKALSKVLGEENCVVVVSAELDFDVHTTEDEIYKPVVGDSGVVRSEQLIEEKYLGTGTVPEIGVPGTTSNIPGYKGLAEGNAEYNRSEETRNYEITRLLDKKQKNQGDIRRLSVAVMLNEDLTFGEAKQATTAQATYLTRRRINDIIANVTAAANLDPTRGDMVSVIPIKFQPGTQGIRFDWQEQARRERIKMIAYIILIALSVICIFLLSFFALRASVVKEEVPEESFIEEDVIEEAVPVEELLMPELTEEQRTREKIKEEVLRMINDDPEGAALIVRSWLFSDMG